MKKARLMLSILCVLAVLSTAFAFTANKYANHFIYTGAIVQPNNATSCLTKVNGAAITGGCTPSVRASTVPLSSGCPAECTTTVSDL
jgi:hypothetical protein